MKTRMQDPMICYPSGEKQSPISGKLLNQANRLLLAAMTRVKANKPLPNLTIGKISEVIQKIIGPVQIQPDRTINTVTEKMPMKPGPSKPPLSQEIIDIAKGLLGDKTSLSLPGLSITRTREDSDNEPKMMTDAVTTQEPATSPEPSMYPETPSMAGPIPGFPPINGLDLNSLDLSSLGIAIPPGLDLNSLDLQNIDLQALGANLDLSSILSQIQPPKRDTMPQPRVAEMEPVNENILERLIRVVFGKDIPINENKDALTAVLKAMEFVLNTDENVLETMFGTLKGVAMESLKEAIQSFTNGSMSKKAGTKMTCYPVTGQMRAYITSSPMNKNTDMCGSCKKEVMVSCDKCCDTILFVFDAFNDIWLLFLILS